MTKLHKYRSNTTVLSDISANLSFSNYPLAYADRDNSTISGSTSSADATFTEDAAVKYDVTVNIFNTSVESYSGSTSVGPLSFSCYNATTTNSNVNFTGQATLTQSDGSAIPSWMAFNGSTGTITVSNTSDIAATTYIVANTYTGIYGNITLSTNVSVTLTEAVTNNTGNNGTNTESKDDDYCMNASSQGLCVVFASLLVVGLLVLTFGMVITLYCVFKSKPQSNMVRIGHQDVNVPQSSREQIEPTAKQISNVPNFYKADVQQVTANENRNL